MGGMGGSGGAEGPRDVVGHSPVGGGGHQSHFPFQVPPGIRGSPPGQSPQPRSPHNAPHRPAPPHGLCSARGGAGGGAGSAGGVGRADGGGGRGERRGKGSWGRGDWEELGVMGGSRGIGGLRSFHDVLGRWAVLGEWERDDVLGRDAGGSWGGALKVTGDRGSAPGRAGLRSGSFGRFRRRSGTSGLARLGSAPLGRGMAPPAGDVSRELQGRRPAPL